MFLKALRSMMIVLVVLVTGASQRQDVDTEILLGGSSSAWRCIRTTPSEV